jgi:glucosamine--fructose-6-phosphate aminotransferase (isomerizing)
VNLASAHLAAAKVSEGAGLIAVPQDTEEWAHLQYFESVLPHTPTFVITSNRRGYSRLLELIEPMKRIGRTVIAVSPDDCTELNAQADFRLVVADGVEELFAAMVYPVGCELFAAYLSEAVHAQYFREDLPRYQAGDNTIYSCQLLAKEDILAHD